MKRRKICCVWHTVEKRGKPWLCSVDLNGRQRPFYIHQTEKASPRDNNPLDAAHNVRCSCPNCGVWTKDSHRKDFSNKLTTPSAFQGPGRAGSLSTPISSVLICYNITPILLQHLFFHGADADPVNPVASPQQRTDIFASAQVRFFLKWCWLLSVWPNPDPAQLTLIFWAGQWCWLNQCCHWRRAIKKWKFPWKPALLTTINKVNLSYPLTQSASRLSLMNHLAGVHYANA